MRLPLDGPTEALGRHALRLLVATDVRTFDSTPGGWPPYLPGSVLDETVRRSYLHLHLGTHDHTGYGPQLSLSTIYDDLDDADFGLQATMALYLSEAEVGTWILRLYGAHRALERTVDAWWRPISEEAGKDL